jgi:hypothetical protein
MKSTRHDAVFTFHSMRTRSGGSWGTVGLHDQRQRRAVRPEVAALLLGGIRSSRGKPARLVLLAQSGTPAPRRPSGGSRRKRKRA